MSPKRQNPPREDASATELYEVPEIQEAYEYVNWPGTPVSYPGLVRIRTHAGSYSLYHAILNGLSTAYRTHELHGVDTSETKLVKGLIQELCATLRVEYDTLMGGKIAEMAVLDPDLHVEALVRQLQTSISIPKSLLPFVCDTLNIDLYYVSGHNRDVFPIMTDMEMIIKGRRSLIVLYCRNHYELMGVLEIRKQKGGTVVFEEFTTVFKADHPLIIQLKRQLGF